ncbi:YsnF/AvaK domain-containing protein [Azohydromonas lata]|uniref:YsnF/AvaK domain-containing protein n=1 Tax=Azohydromonas lata TaxID=45677 RepID=A0ABU5I9I1_9BURK|nr:YsnF/AvaK domain-containing protein [Azohydromonas lata]MDZ5455618.1 YsnF/AvaK domain-containing protein [Azohydromonas lata]
MKQTVVGLFDSEADAQRALQILTAKGTDPSHVQITHAEDAFSADSATQADAGTANRVRGFFSDMFDPADEREVGHYAEAVRRGGALLKVEIDDDAQLDDVREAFTTASAVDIDQRMEAWRAQGWTDSAGTAAVQSSEGVIPVVQEELRVGKRVVSTGGLRVYARTVETPVSETVQLRQEHVQVERRPVDRPATAADLADLKDRTIEVVETAEQAVVQKTARVVEEVRVGKTVEQRTEQVSDTVRSTEVEVEHIPGTTTVGTFDRDYYRNDFNARFAAEGGRYEDYEPAYRYGHDLRDDPRYAGRSWDEFEADARKDWEVRNPGSAGAWDRMKAAVRRGWERVSS